MWEINIARRLQRYYRTRRLGQFEDEKKPYVST